MFDLNNRVEFTIRCRVPKEIMWKDEKKGDTRVFIFDVEHDGEDKIVMTSSWSFIRAMKAISNAHDGDLMNVRVRAQKMLKAGKQHYTVEEVAQ